MMCTGIVVGLEAVLGHGYYIEVLEGDFVVANAMSVVSIMQIFEKV